MNPLPSFAGLVPKIPLLALPIRLPTLFVALVAQNVRLIICMLLRIVVGIIGIYGNG